MYVICIEQLQCKAKLSFWTCWNEISIHEPSYIVVVTCVEFDLILSDKPCPVILLLTVCMLIDIMYLSCRTLLKKRWRRGAVPPRSHTPGPLLVQHLKSFRRKEPRSPRFEMLLGKLLFGVFPFYYADSSRPFFIMDILFSNMFVYAYSLRTLFFGTLFSNMFIFILNQPCNFITVFGFIVLSVPVFPVTQLLMTNLIIRVNPAVKSRRG